MIFFRVFRMCCKCDGSCNKKLKLFIIFCLSANNECAFFFSDISWHRAQGIRWCKHVAVPLFHVSFLVTAVKNLFNLCTFDFWRNLRSAAQENQKWQEVKHSRENIRSILIRKNTENENLWLHKKIKNKSHYMKLIAGNPKSKQARTKWIINTVFKQWWRTRK